MPLVYRNALLPVPPLYDDMDRLVTGLLGQTPDWTLPGTLRSLPPVDVWEDGEKIVVEAEIPGLKSDQIEISVIGDELSLKFQRPDLAEDGVKYYRRERLAGSFTRLVRLPAEVDAAGIRAELHDGVLHIALPKSAGAKVHKITVKTA